MVKNLGLKSKLLSFGGWNVKIDYDVWKAFPLQVVNDSKTFIIEFKSTASANRSNDSRWQNFQSSGVLPVDDIPQIKGKMSKSEILNLENINAFNLSRVLRNGKKWAQIWKVTYGILGQKYYRNKNHREKHTKNW